ncbi:hypothetical protein CK227_10300 [Mesorhizobium sp. WSM4308]|uniref:hypothetical protein n=1 Tax=Mesorhizobium sp. WSM4308 TaxID=2029409 RepID=UPI000BAF057B|nr:hypothetical protein [Mesorhizobium sp. WSM4308]PBB75174.1 hypothetical protein CK227_10300 [Mesorhizobium sp. WSM4308]
MNATDKPKLGYSDGDVCNRAACAGVIEMHKSEDCSCHINPPCFSCTSVTAFCPVCEWEEADDPLVVQEIASIHFGNDFAYVERAKRILDPTKIDYRIEMHSNASQKVIGVYPDGTTRQEVEAVVKGTFGGRFSSFKDGRFEYIAYTD